MLCAMPDIEMNSVPKGTTIDAFKTSIPVLLGYVTIGFGFGLLAVNTGYPPWFALAMSVFVYAGAAQYIGIGLFAAGASIPEIMIITFVANIRHAAYGLSLLKHYSRHPRIKPYLVFALTDETYALISSLDEHRRQDGHFMLLISAFDQAYWVIGTALGALIGSIIPEKIRGLDYALTAMFIVLATEQYLKLKKPLPFLLAALATLTARFLVGSRLTILVGLAGAILLTYLEQRREKNHA